MPDVMKEIEEGIELVSNGLLILDTYHEKIKELVGPKAVDIAARLNAQSNSMGKLLMPLKDALKAEALRDKIGLIRGDLYDAEINVVFKTVLNTEKVKTFLAKKLAQFQTRREEVQINFKVKS